MVQLFNLHSLSLSECYIAARAEKLFYISQTSSQLRFMCELMCLHTIWNPELKSTRCCCCRVCRGSVCGSATVIAGWLQRVECTVNCLVMSFQSLRLWQQLWVFRTQLKWHAISNWDSSFLILLFLDCARQQLLWRTSGVGLSQWPRARTSSPSSLAFVDPQFSALNLHLMASAPKALIFETEQ